MMNLNNIANNLRNLNLNVMIINTKNVKRLYITPDPTHPIKMSELVEVLKIANADKFPIRLANGDQDGFITGERLMNTLSRKTYRHDKKNTYSIFRGTDNLFDENFYTGSKISDSVKLYGDAIIEIKNHDEKDELSGTRKPDVITIQYQTMNHMNKVIL